MKCNDRQPKWSPQITAAVTVAMIAGVLSLSGCITAHTRTLLSASAVARLGGAKSVVEVEKSKNVSTQGWKKWWQEVEPPSQRTALLLRRYDLEEANLNSPDQVIRWLHQLTQNRPSLEEVHALAELAEKQARWSTSKGDTERATRMYSTAIVHAYQFLFDGDLNVARNAYDPQFRSICDIYNRSLEALLRQIIVDDKFGHGYQATLGTTEQGVQLTVQLDGRWKDQLFDRFELVSDYEVSGFENEYRTYGLGAPLIAVRKSRLEEDDALEKHYPPELTIPLTAFLHLKSKANVVPVSADRDEAATPPKIQTAVLTLYDPLEKTYARAENSTVPLESNITTPLAYGLKDPLVNKGLLATASLLDAEFAPEAYGMFMVEPYDPQKIPVVLVHGLWDGPATWAHMINDLAATRELHDNYQFWFYSYPTAQPFWVSANQFRKDLSAIRSEVDPGRTNPVMEEMVLVGHSMGGLISMLQTIDSGDRFWEIASDRPISELKGDPKTKAALEEMFYFKANPSIKKLITLATPFKGSDFANRTTQWISHRLITLPSLITNDFEKLALQNVDVLKDPYFLTRSNSIDSLATTNPMFKAIAESELPKGLSFHNVVGRLDKTGVFHRHTTEESDVGDGVVALSSGVDRRADSQVYVAAEHSTLHQQPGSILEVRRLLLEQLGENDRVQPRPIPPSIRSANSEAYYR